MIVELLMAGVLGAADAPKPEKPAEGPAANPPTVTLTCRPTTFQMSSYVHFNEKGEPQTTQFNCILSIEARYKSSARVMGVSSIEVKKIVTDSGQTVTPVKQSHEFYQEMQRQGEPVFHLGLTMPAPPARIKSYSEVSGTVKLTCADGPLRYATIGPWKDVANHTVRVEGLGPPVSVALRKEAEARRFRVEYGKSSTAVLDSVRAQDGRGRDLRLEEQGSSNGDSMTTRFYAGDLPEDGFVILAFYEKAKDVVVPFEVHDVPLPKPPDAQNADLVVKVTDKPPTGAVGKNGAPLKVIVE